MARSRDRLGLHLPVVVLPARVAVPEGPDTTPLTVEGMNSLARARRYVGVILVTLVVALGGAAVVHAATTTTKASCSGGAISKVTGGQKFSLTCVVPDPPPVTVTVTASPTPVPAPSPTTSSPTPTPTDSPTTTAPSPTPTVTTTPTTSGTWSCVVPLGGGCPKPSGAYKDTTFSSNSNGWNTYVGNQDVGWAGQGTQTMYVNGPRNWQVVSNIGQCGGCVQTFPDTQQLFNSSGSPTALSSLSALTVNYDETSPGGAANGYEFAADIWSNYLQPNGTPQDVMFWVDTNLRCATVGGSGEVIDHITIDGQNWTVRRWGSDGGAGSKYGDELIVTLDGPTPGSCAVQPKGSIDVKAGMEALAAKGLVPAASTITQVNTGWEITQSSNATFTLNDMTYTVK